MTALIQQRLTRLLATEDGHQRRCLRVILSEVTAEPALSVMKRLHSAPPSADVTVGAASMYLSCLAQAAALEKPCQLANRNATFSLWYPPVNLLEVLSCV